MPSPTNRDSDKFMLRLPPGMRDEIRKEADRAGRSMNAEIVARLEGSFRTRADRELITDVSQEILAELRRQLRRQEVDETD